MTVFAGQPPAKPGQSNICMNDTIVKIPIVVQKWHANLNFYHTILLFFTLILAPTTIVHLIIP